MSLQLYVGNKNYSSWSMRPWVLLKQAGIPFEEVMLRFGDMAPGSPFKTQLARVCPTGRVPVLLDNGLAVWDTLAIAEYVAEKFPEKTLWPTKAAARARARSVCAEMHSGFSALRNHFPMNIEASFPEIGERVLRTEPQVHADLDRIVQMWSELLGEYGGPLLFGEFSIADAYFAPVVKRLLSYAVPVPSQIKAYIERVQALPSVVAWTTDALAEHDFIEVDEPYRKAR
ncbi:MAG: glutathione S-transferase family protein [Rhizobacter sp.]